MSMQPKSVPETSPESRTEPLWQWLLQLAAAAPQARAGQPPPAPESASQQAFVDLYVPFAGCGAETGCVVAHLGQSIDGFVATDSGDSYYVTGPQNLDHLHRMRALADAVIVGAGTVAADDPALTTRRVSGPNPVRVVLDTRCRLGAQFRVFSDAAAPTLLICAQGAGSGGRHGAAEVLRLPARADGLEPALVVAALAERGLRRVFVEGGGSVVSDFLRAGVLDRLQLTIAPVMIGAGTRGVRAPAQARMSDCLRPPHRVFCMGDDLLFDYDLRAGQPAEPQPDAELRRLR